MEEGFNYESYWNEIPTILLTLAPNRPTDG